RSNYSKPPTSPFCKTNRSYRPETVQTARDPPPGFRNKKFPTTRKCSLRTIFLGNSSGSLIRARNFSLALRTLCSVLKPYQWKPEHHPILGKCSLWAGSDSSVILRESTI